jgi:hypothetical protein
MPGKTNASRTPKQQVRAARARLEYARVKIFGTVLAVRRLSPTR